MVNISQHVVCADRCEAASDVTGRSRRQTTDTQFDSEARVDTCRTTTAQVTQQRHQNARY